LKRLFSHLARFRHIRRDPASAIELPKNPRGLPTSGIKDREIQLLLESASTDTQFGLRDRAILETLYSTGVRNKELRFVKVQDIDFEMGLLRINTPKGGALYQRVIAIGKNALYWVQRYLKESRSLFLKWGTKKEEMRNGKAESEEDGRDENREKKNGEKGNGETLLPVTASDKKTLARDYLFLNKEGSRMSSEAMLRVVKNALFRSKLRNPRIVTHSFRVACATGMLKGRGQKMQGADIKWVQEQLGHANIQSTSKYLRLVPGELKRIHSLHHPRENYRNVMPKTTKTNL
jgi:integrase/recombinase XerD